jgi:paraquat-inducible protein B
MKNRSNPKLIGAFVLGAVALAVGAVVVLGSGRLFRKTDTFVLFFNGNVNGLRVGAPVKIKGVQIGSVSNILLSLDIGQGSGTVRVNGGQIQIPVLVEIDESRMVQHGASAANLSNPADVRRAIAQGLRAQLAMESLLTGLLYIDLDLHPGTPAHFVAPEGFKFIEIPTLPTAFEQAQSAATRLVSQIDKIQLDKLIQNATDALAGINSLVQSPELKSALLAVSDAGQSVKLASESIQQFSNRVGNAVGPMTASMQKSTQSVDLALEKAQIALDHIQMTLQPNSPLIYRADDALQQIDEAAKSVRQLADYLQRNPSALVRGRYYGGQ